MTEQIDHEANLKKLIEALESDRYTQGTRFLRDELDPSCMCIQGIMCDIAVDEGVGYWGTEGFVVNSDVPWGTNYYAPNVVCDLFVPMDWARYGFPKYDELRTFFVRSAERNDNRNWTFQDFADELKRINNLPNH